MMAKALRTLEAFDAVVAPKKAAAGAAPAKPGRGGKKAESP